MNGTNFDIEKMSLDNDIPIVLIKVKLGIPLLGECNATTVEEAKKAYDNTPSDSEAEVSALKKWVELTTTVKEAKEAHGHSSGYSEVQALALKKWNELSIIEVEKATTAKEAKKAYDNTPSDSEAEALALKKWLEFTTTVEEAKEAYENAPSDSKVEFLALKKWVELATTAKEAKEAYARSGYPESEVSALKKWEELSIIEVGKVTTVEKAKKAYDNTPSDSEAEALAFKKLATFYGWKEK